MRKVIRIPGVAAGTFLLALGVAQAADDRFEPSTEGRAYLNLSFGGEKLAPRGLHYGLRFDQDRRFAPEQAAPLMQFDFTSRGMNDMRVNGLSVLKAQYRLRQAEEEAAEEGMEGGGEEQGFFEGMWSGVTGFFGGLFGGDEDEVEETADAEDVEGAEEAPEEIAEGTFMGYNAIDWGLLAVGAVGLGYVVSEVSNGDDDPDLVDSDGDGIPDNEDPPEPPCDGLVDPITGTCIPTAPFGGRLGGGAGTGKVDPAYQEWLDGGTGHMGDLGG